MAVKTFTAGSVLTASDTNTYLANSGLVVVTPGTPTGATLSGAKIVISSGSSSVVVPSAFSATYDAYRIVVNNVVASVESNVTFQLGPTSVSGYNTSYGGGLIYVSWASAGVSEARDNNATKFSFIGNTGANHGSLAFDVNNPFNSKYTTLGPSSYNSGGGSGIYNGVHQQSQSYTGFTIAPTSGTWTSGTIMIYGYRLG